MRTIHTLAADAIGDESTVEPLTIVCDLSVAEGVYHDDAWRAYYRRKAGELLDAMQVAVPGGLLDAGLRRAVRSQGVAPSGGRPDAVDGGAG